MVINSRDQYSSLTSAKIRPFPRNYNSYTANMNTRTFDYTCIFTCILTCTHPCAALTHTHTLFCLGDLNKKLSKCQKLLSGIGGALTSSNQDHLQPILPYITNMLENTHQAIVSALSGNSEERNLSSFEESFTVGPGQKHQTQPRSFYPTTQRSGRKRQNLLK